MSPDFTPASSNAFQIAGYAMSLSGFSVNWPVACAPTPMMATSRMVVTAFGRHILVGEGVLVFRCVGQRLDHDPHCHAVFENAVLNRAFRADQRENARPFVEIDKSLKVRRLESVGRKSRNGVAEQAAFTTDLDILHRAVAATGRAHRHSRKNHGAARAALRPEQRGRLCGIGRHYDAGECDIVTRYSSGCRFRRPNVA